MGEFPTFSRFPHLSRPESHQSPTGPLRGKARIRAASSAGARLRVKCAAIRARARPLRRDAVVGRDGTIFGVPARAALAVCGGYDPARLGNPSEQIGVRSRSDEVKVLAIDLIDQQPVRFNVAVAKVLPLAAKRMVLVAGRQQISLDQQLDRLTQLRHVLAALLSKSHVAPELRAAIGFRKD